MTVKIAIAGTGFGARVHVPAFQGLPGIAVVAVASRNREKAAETARIHSLPEYFDDFETMLDATKPDLVSIATPPFLHHEMALAAARRGIHVLCEKPLALNLKQALEMTRAVEGMGLINAVAHEFRLFPGRVALADRIREGLVGPPRFVEIQWHANLFPDDRDGPFDWWWSANLGGGVLGAVGSHYIDMLHTIFGEIGEVSAGLSSVVGSRRAPDGGHPVGVTSDDTAILQLRTRDGLPICMTLTAVAGNRGSRVSIHGHNASLVLENDQKLFVSYGPERAEPLTIPPARIATPAGAPMMLGAFRELALRVTQRLQGDSGAPIPSFRVGLAVQAVLDAARLSSTNRAWTPVVYAPEIASS